ncbi:hypothetical protein [Hymenobacter latericus]|uniref:hypothetical protein n=1 Tax=Hymenobacter sp. YIM 151858-1 TaxID=2987688 RepID=UPI002225F18E|nr:hypothetical protein [Hymenobacter sp. YIM 151858-1]UYZ60155.1 hypothetical protein OIS50_04970 [Hymenobacter sp. YIM 151858-1]
MTIPNQAQLEAAKRHLVHAAALLAPHLQRLQARIDGGPTMEELMLDDEARARMLEDQMLLQALVNYGDAVETQTAAMTDVVDECIGEMARAQFVFHQMKLDRDFFQHSARTATAMFHQAGDILIARTIAARRHEQR